MAAIGVETMEAEQKVAQVEVIELQTVKWWSDPGLRKLYFWAAVLCVASVTSGYDGSMLNNAQNLDSWQAYFDHPEGSKLGLMNAVYQIGSLCSFPFVPYVADWWGRKLPIAIGCLLMVVGGLIGTFTNSYGMYVGGRFVLGFGNSFAQMASPLLLTEICHPQHRGKVTAMYNCLWGLGALFAAWITWATSTIHSEWSWKTLALLQVVPSVIQLTFIYWVPESPRWYISKERYDEALGFLAKYHANGNDQDTTVQFEFREIKETLELEFQFQKTSNYMDFFKTKGNRYRFMLLVSLGVFSQYSGNALFSNYINIVYNSIGITNQNQKIPLSGGNYLLVVIVALCCALLVDRVGRRTLFLIATTGMFCMFLAWTITAAVFENSNNTKIKSAGYPQIIWVWIFGVFHAVAWSGLPIAYSLEILPYKLRAKGLMILNLVMQAALVLGNYTNPIAWNNLPHHWNFELFYTVWIFVELVFVYFFYIETRGPTLEEVTKIFDGKNAEVSHVEDIHQV